MNLKKFFDEKPFTAFMIGAGVILLIAVCVFLFTKDNAANPYSVTGWQVLGMQSFSFWLWAIFFTALAGVGIWAANKYLINGGDSKPFGNWWILIAVFLSIAWGKACTDKANDGVTAPGFTPTEKVDDGRVPAEELIKEK